MRERGWVERGLGRAAFVVEIAKGPAEVFGPLKAALTSISAALTKYQVRFDTLFDKCPCQSHPQGIIAVKDKIEILHSRIAVLEQLFERPTSDGKETKRREGLLMYASCLHLDWMLKPS